MYYIVSLAKFGNCCSMVWACRQGKWKGKTKSGIWKYISLRAFCMWWVSSMWWFRCSWTQSVSLQDVCHCISVDFCGEMLVYVNIPAITWVFPTNQFWSKWKLSTIWGVRPTNKFDTIIVCINTGYNKFSKINQNGLLTINLAFYGCKLLVRAEV